MILIKLGGSLITDKSQPQTFLPDIMDRLAEEIKQFTIEHPLEPLIIGHGSGSFGHIEAKKYKTNQGFVNDDSKLGFCRVHAVAAELNQLIIKTLLKHDLPVFPIQPSAIINTSVRSSPTTQNSLGGISTFHTPIIRQLLNQKLIPILYGDAVLDHTQGCAIASTETILNYLAIQLKSIDPETGNQNPQILKIIQATNVDGVLISKSNQTASHSGISKSGNQNQIKNNPISDVPNYLDSNNLQLVSKITSQNFHQIKPHLTDSYGTDVTGGMLHKVESALNLAHTHHITTQIINGTKPNYLYHALKSNLHICTIITYDLK